ncbi:hypothetical protein GIY56_11630 [Paracoccus sp. YIM 132242]|uniref:Porin family protein n=1 Tax=Paracoccus lichenicola TaxID=2665644 RepID=A0A6L6HSC5_9RHOB|nr:hypothetical protein [Paracoccus lichenicola]MTE00945.1 hypothetical protein [Paracoccus lichenicola]
MNLVRFLSFLLPVAICASPILAQDVGAMAGDAPAFQNTFYIGGGKARTDDAFDNDDTPFSLGFMHQLAGRKLILGGDLGQEGTMLDSTWGQDQAVEQATSYNLLAGANVVDNGRFRTDVALLLGVREDTKDCPRSYLGFQCYADSDPETDYKGNFGAVLTVSFDRLTLGVRATGESTQVLAGLRF